MTITITHTRAAGTLVEGTEYGDGTAEILKSSGFRWSRNLGQWYIAGSRDLPPRKAIIRVGHDALTAAGFTVAIKIDDTPRDTATVEAERAERQAARVAALEAKAARKHKAVDQAEARYERARQSVPPMQEPVKYGHHSAPRHLRSIERANAAMSAAVAARDTARYTDAKAEAATHTTAHRENAGVTARRIDKLNEELRAAERNRDGYVRNHLTSSGEIYAQERRAPATGEYRDQLNAQIAELTEKIAYWRAHVEAAKEAGAFLADKSMVRKGDWVRHLHRWHQVVRVNAKTVTVTSLYIDGRQDRLPYDQIAQICPAGQQPDDGSQTPAG